MSELEIGEIMSPRRPRTTVRAAIPRLASSPVEIPRTSYRSDLGGITSTTTVAATSAPMAMNAAA